MHDLDKADFKNILDLVTSLVHVKSISAFSEMLINSKEQIGVDHISMTELIFNKTVTNRLIFTDYPAMVKLNDYTIPQELYENDKVYPQILAGKEVIKVMETTDILKDLISVDMLSQQIEDKIYSRHILSKMNKETMTANLIIFAIDDPAKSNKFDSMAAYLHIHLMSAYVRIMGARDVLPERLSERELSVLTWLKHGKTSWEVAKILNITENTVNFHIKNIKRKLNATNRQHSVAIAIAKGIIE